MAKSYFFDVTWYDNQKCSQPKDHSGDNEKNKFPNITKYD